MPNQDQFMSWLRTTLSGIGFLVVQRGWATDATVTMVIGAVLSIAPFAWGYFAHTDSAKLAAVEAMPDVKEIVAKSTATDGVAAAVKDSSRPKVVSAPMAA
jgi:hypothetical protein